MASWLTFFSAALYGKSHEQVDAERAIQVKEERDASKKVKEYVKKYMKASRGFALSPQHRSLPATKRPDRLPSKAHKYRQAYGMDNDQPNEGDSSNGEIEGEE